MPLDNFLFPPPFGFSLQGFSFYEVETLFETHLRQLIGWGIYSFVAAVEVSALMKHMPTVLGLRWRSFRPLSRSLCLSRYDT